MATLKPGEKARMYALGKLARGGATRGGYVSAKVFISIDGAHVGFGGTPGAGHIGVLLDSLTITDELNEASNTCQFRTNGMIPTAGALVRITLGSKNGGAPLFAGFALHVEQLYTSKPANIQADVSCVDYTWLFGFVKVTKVYRALSASAIAADLVASFGAANGFTSLNVQAGLPVVDQITFTNEELDQAMTRLATRIGAYWYVDYVKDIHFFIDETLNGAPEVLTPQHRSLADFKKLGDRAQVLTRVFVEGRGTTILGAVKPGDTLVPVEAIDMFAVAADVFAKVSPHGSDGGAQHVSFTGVIAGGAGSLVGPGVGPPGAPAVGRATGSELAVGRYQYAYTDVTPSGETKPSPLATIDVGGPIAPPTVPPTNTALVSATGLDDGQRYYAYTYVTASGETLPGPNALPIETIAPMTPIGGIAAWGQVGGGIMTPYYYRQYAVTYIGNNGGETTPAPYFTTPSVGSCTNCGITLSIGGLGAAALPEGVTQVNVYRGGAFPDSASAYASPKFMIGVATKATDYATTKLWYFTDLGYTTSGPAPPTTNSAQVYQRKVRITTTASPDAFVTGAKIYRARPGQAFKLVAQVNGGQGAVTYDDALPDASLGAQAPITDTTGGSFRAVALSNIAPGASPTTARRVYRTPVNGTQLLWLWDLADNVSTTLADHQTDAQLGAAAPTSDTSGLAQVPGQIPAGSAEMVVANLGPFEDGGGWAVIGNGEQVIRYTSKSGTALLGIPASGIGAIVAAVAYNSTITAAPMLTGLPASGVRAIGEALTPGDDINLVVQRDNTQRQTDLATMVKIGPGLREEWVQDRRLSIGEARARGDATLAQRPLEDVTITYRCRDLRTSSGKTITVNLPAPTNVGGSFKIQTVTITKFRPFPTQYPTFTVTASSQQFSFEDWLRRFETKV